MMKRTATALWKGTIKEGAGAITTQTKTLSATPYSFAARFESGAGTNPEELLGAAHAGCFAMAWAYALSGAGVTPRELQAQAVVSLEQKDGGFAITQIHLVAVGRVAAADAEKTKAAAMEAKKNCPLSKALASVNITLDVTIES